MAKRMDNLCIIPARGGSKRIPRKNVAELCGKPLIAYTIEAALRSGLFGAVVVSTDDAEIASVSRRYGAEVMDRSSRLSGDRATVIDVCLDVVARCKKQGRRFRRLCILLPTSPLRDADDLRAAFRKFSKSSANALMAVTTYAIPPFWALKEEKGFLVPYFGQDCMVRSQDLPEVFVDNGAIYLFDMGAFMKEKRFYCSKLVAFRMPREKSVDVDTPADLSMAGFFLRQRRRGK